MLPGLLGPPVQEGVTLSEYLAVQVDHFAKTFRNQVSDPVGDRAPVTPPDHDHVDQVIEVQQVNDVLDVRRKGDRLGTAHMSSFGQASQGKGPHIVTVPAKPGTTARHAQDPDHAPETRTNTAMTLLIDPQLCLRRSSLQLGQAIEPRQRRAS